MCAAGSAADSEDCFTALPPRPRGCPSQAGAFSDDRRHPAYALDPRNRAGKFVLGKLLHGDRELCWIMSYSRARDPMRALASLLFLVEAGGMRGRVRTRNRKKSKTQRLDA